MATTFDRFRYLPRELRDEIWRFAIRPTRPGVHIFRLYYDFEDDHAGSRDILSLARFFTGKCLAESPRDQYFHSSNTDCGDRDVSTYLIDGGLWLACKESRVMMEKYFLNSDRDYLRRHQSAASLLKLWFMPETGYFTSSSGAPHYFTVIPRCDLFVLQPDLLSSIDRNWGHLEIPVGLTERVTHIAIEYNLEWGFILHQPRQHEKAWGMVQALESFAHNAYGNSRLWFIDHSLKRNKDAPVFKEVPSGYFTNAFYASDRKFLEVECGPEGLNLDHWQYTQQVEEGIFDTDSSVSFLSLLRAGVSELDDFFGLRGWDDL
ncbi:2EXR domain-containing protein [Fusarium sp. LHS14.1]|nr:2EXR domain-containing protein [Fusarium sp. LHS14.1]